MLWFLPAIGAAVLAYGFHRSDHHFEYHSEVQMGADDGLFKAEHAFGWLLALGAIAMGALDLLVGFDVFDNGYAQTDGLIWGMGALGGSILAGTLHAVRHHQYAGDEAYIASVVERVTVPPPMGTGETVREPRVR
jgi:hypothetical protein